MAAFCPDFVMRECPKPRENGAMLTSPIRFCCVYKRRLRPTTYPFRMPMLSGSLNAPLGKLGKHRQFFQRQFHGGFVGFDAAQGSEAPTLSRRASPLSDYA